MKPAREARVVNTHEELLDVLALALLDHQRIKPHHSGLCDLCHVMTQAIAKAEGKL